MRMGINTRTLTRTFRLIRVLLEVKWPRRDSNPQAFWAWAPKTHVYANSTTRPVRTQLTTTRRG